MSLSLSLNINEPLTLTGDELGYRPWIRIPNLMATLYNAEHVHIAQTRIPTTYFCIGQDRVATAQGKQGIWFLLFPDRENTGNFALTQGKILRHRENIFL